ncbi:MAG TPA: DUF6569 family protein, partial [Kofleriaceae bacterium]|nr:DUF6569 family protein [Kofleriaceae bacterium]
MRLLLVVALAACAEKDPAPPVVVEAPEPVVIKRDLKLAGGFEMRGLIKDGRLAIVPIVATEPLPDARVLTLDEGMASKRVIVREMPGDWQVPTVRITNKSDLPLLVLQGELIEGGKQDRVMADTRVILANSTQNVPVRCVEESRDQGGNRFSSGHAIAELTLRRTIAFAEQPEVWTRVHDIN